MRENIRNSKRDLRICFLGSPQLNVEEFRQNIVLSPEQADILFVRFDHIPPNPIPERVRVVCSNMSDPPWNNGTISVPVVTTKDIDLRDITPAIEHTWGLIHAAHRRITAVAADSFGFRDDWIVPKSLSNSLITIFGGGRVGHAVSKIGIAYRALVHIVEIDTPKDLVEDSLRATDILVCCASRTSHEPVITSDMLDLLDAESVVVNTSYGDAIDFKHLLTCLTNGYIRCAALDVIPLCIGNATKEIIKNLIVAGRLIVTPHIAGSTKDARIKTERRVIDKAVEVFNAR